MPVIVTDDQEIPEETGAEIPGFAVVCHYCSTGYNFDKRDGRVFKEGFIEVNCPTCDHINEVAT